MKVFYFIKNTIKSTLESIKNFKENPLDSLGQIIPVAMGITAFIGFITAYLMFIMNEGYTTQVELFGINGFSGITKVFTSGTVYIMYRGIVPTIINVLLFAQLIVIMITYFKWVSKVIKVLFIIDFVIIGILTGTIAFLGVVGFKKLTFQEMY